jgi:hypothetical protein
MKRVIVVGYPDTFSFETEMEFPKFKYGCETRTSLLHLELEKNNPSQRRVSVKFYLTMFTEISCLIFVGNS